MPQPDAQPRSLFVPPPRKPASPLPFGWRSPPGVSGVDGTPHETGTHVHDAHGKRNGGTQRGAHVNADASVRYAGPPLNNGGQGGGEALGSRAGAQGRTCSCSVVSMSRTTVCASTPLMKMGSGRIPEDDGTRVQGRRRGGYRGAGGGEGATGGGSGGTDARRDGAIGPHAHGNAARHGVDDQDAEGSGQQKP